MNQFCRLFILWALFSGVGSVAFAAQPAQPGAKTSSQAEWDRVLKAAKDEGSVVVLGPPGNDVRKALTEPFEKTFPGIKVEYNGATGAVMSPRLMAERKAGQYLADIHVGNPGTTLTTLFPAGALDPIKPALILPEAVDPSKWWRGKIEFSDREEKYNVVFSTNVMAHAAVNPQMVKKDEVRSYTDFLSAKWQGKMVMLDPTILGPGSATLGFWYLHPDLGKDFIRKFLTPERVTISRDNRQILDWLGKGNYLAAVGPSELLTTEFTAKGMPISLLHADQFREGGMLNAGFGAIALINRAPHPNAAKVYINWLLSREGQAEYSRASGYPSRRLDVPRDQFNPGSLPKEGVPYIIGYDEQFSRRLEEAMEFARSLLKK